MVSAIALPWAAVHGVHHSTSDANFIPIIEQADFIEWVENHPELAKLNELPKIYPNLDSVADLTREDVLAIGGAARKLVEDQYDPPTSYTKKHTNRLLDTIQPRYFYAPRRNFIQRLKDKRAGVVPIVEPPPPQSIHSLAHKLRDPHSPALHKIRRLWSVDG